MTITDGIQLLTPRARWLVCGVLTMFLLVPAIGLAHSLPEGIKASAWQDMFMEPTPVTDFSLQTAQGQPFTQANLKGRWHLVFFGFTSCPDICPVHMAQLAQMRQQLVAQGYEESQLPQVLLVTVDPQRDTPEKLGQYVANFDTSFLGITGDMDAIKTLEKSLGSAHRTFSEDVNGDYDVMHSASIYAINPQGQLVAKLLPPFSPAKLLSYYQALRDDHPDSDAPAVGALQP